MPEPSPHTLDLLRLTLVPGIGPVLIDRLLECFGSADGVLQASPKSLERVRGIGSAKSRAIAEGVRASGDALDEELTLADELGVTIVGRTDADYPTLLREAPSSPPILYVFGKLDPTQGDRYPVAIVGSRGCTAYGIEQAERFAGVLAAQGLTVVSGGARGIDSAAHRGSMRERGRTVAVLGCGLAHRYPPENKDLFAAIADGRGAVVSELPLRTAPTADNFPARNRIISGISLGVVVIEASAGSGALITARYAAEDHGREVMVVPGRVDSPSSEGSNDLIRRGGAALVTSPGDVIELLEAPARHLHAGTHEPRYADPAREGVGVLAWLSEVERAVLAALADSPSVAEVVERSGIDAGAVRVALTRLEISGLVRRESGSIRVVSAQLSGDGGS